MFWLVFLLNFHRFLSLSLYIDSSYTNSDSDGTIERPLNDYGVIGNILTNQLANTLIIKEVFLVESSLLLENMDFLLIFR